MLIWFSGLIRGAIAFALSLEINSEIAPHRDQMVSTTLMMVLMTTVVLGGVMSAFAKLIGLDAETADENEIGDVRESTASRLTDIVFKSKKKSWLQIKFNLLDDKILKPLFGGNMSKLEKHKEERREEEERRTQFQKIQAIKNRQTEKVANQYGKDRLDEAEESKKGGRGTQFDGKTDKFMQGTKLDMICEDEEDD